MIDRLIGTALAVGIGTPAPADAWQTFDQVCLAAMERSAATDVTGLVLAGSSGGADEPVAMAQYRDADDREVSVQRQGNVSFCNVRSLAAEQGAVALAYTRWLDTVFADRRYTTVNPFQVQSTGWRTPDLVMEYNARWGDGRATLSLGEWPENE